MKFALALTAGLAAAVQVKEDRYDLTLHDDYTFDVHEDDNSSVDVTILDDYTFLVEGQSLEEYEDNYSDDWEECEWNWEECSYSYWRYPCSGEDTETDCGYFYWDDWNYLEYWVTCEEFSEWYWCHEDETWDDGYVDEWCDNEW